MGDDDDDHHVFKYRHPQPVYQQRWSGPAAAAGSSSSVFSLHRVLLPLVYAAAMVHCGSSLRTHSHLTSLASSVLTQVEFHRQQNVEAWGLLNEVTQKETDVTKKLAELKATSNKLLHEQRMKEVMEERLAGEPQSNDAILQHLANTHKKTAMTWIDQRHTALMEQIETLQGYVQEQSRQYVLAEYGMGPHRVEFQVQLPHKKNSQSKFVVELAPLDLMPHSNEIFLDMVANEAWDNTVFYHHLQHTHVLAAAPVNFGTFEPKNHHWKALGYTGLSFPEYSGDWPHEEYTLGFSGKGPNFYINALDNSKNHGPGTQNHHDLASDADPCFAKVVWGKQVIQDMMPTKGAPPGTGTTKQATTEDPVSWKDLDVTQIVSVRLQNRKKRVPGSQGGM